VAATLADHEVRIAELEAALRNRSNMNVMGIMEVLQELKMKLRHMI
jgi:hypothetical protein